MFNVIFFAEVEPFNRKGQPTIGKEKCRIKEAKRIPRATSCRTWIVQGYFWEEETSNWWAWHRGGQFVNGFLSCDWAFFLFGGWCVLYNYSLVNDAAKVKRVWSVWEILLRPCFVVGCNVLFNFAWQVEVFKSNILNIW